MKDGFSRRDFLFIGGATLAGVTLGEAGRRALARGDERLQSRRGPGVERWAPSVCRECPAACGVRVRLVDGVPVKLEGNPSCPIARGRLCAKGQAALEGYFDPDRLVGPARRAGRRGEHRWEPITWDAAVALLAARLSTASDRPGSQPVAFAAEEHGPLAGAWARFWEAAGGVAAWTLALTPARLRPALTALTGVERDPLFDLAHATHVVSFGAPLVEDWLSPVWAQRSYGQFRRGPSGTRGRLVQIDVHRSMTARKADEWISVALEHQLTLAYGLASVILRENRASRQFLEASGGTMQPFEREVVEAYAPDEVAGATGVPVVTLLRLARELTASARPLVVCRADAPPSLAVAVGALNALVGALDRDGGVFASPAAPIEQPLDAAPVLREIAAGTRRPRLIAFRDASTLRGLAALPDVKDGLEKAELIVSFSPYLDEAADVADLLLPAPTPVESWHGVMPPGVIRGDCIALAAPAASSPLDTRDALAVLQRVARTVGGGLAGACTWASAESLVLAEVERLFAARRGGPYSNVHETAWLQQLERGGWWVPTAPSGRAFASAVLDAGGWNDPYFQPGAIDASLRARRGVSWPNARLTVASLTTAASHALNRSVPLAPEEQFPLRLIVFTPPEVGLSAGANHPVLFELLGQPEGTPWRVWAELGPDTARECGVTQGSEVRIISEHGGSLDAVAVVVAGMARGTIALAFVPASPAGGRWARLVQTDVRALIGREGTAAGTAVRAVAL